MRIGTDGDMSRRLDLEAWAAQLAAMHLTVSRMTPAATPTGGSSGDQGATVPAVTSAESVRAQVLASRQGQMTVQDGVGYLQLASSDLERSQDALRRMRVVASQAADGTFDAVQREALQKYVDRGVQDLEGIAEQARYHTLRMLGGTAASWSLPERAVSQSAAVAASAPGVPAPPRPTAPGAVGAAAVAAPEWVPAAAGVAPVATVPPTAVPPTTRPDQSTDAGYETRPGGLAGRGVNAGPSDRVDPVDPSLVSSVDPGLRPGSAGAARPGTLAGRVPIGTPDQARDLVGRLDTASDLLAQVGAAVDAAEQSLLRTIGQLGLDQVRLPGDGAPATGAAPGSVVRQLDLQAVTSANASALVEATRAQFDAVTTVLGGTAAAAAVGAQVAVLPREAAMAARPAVEPVTTATRSSRTETGRERGDRGGSGGGIGRR